MGNRCVDGVKFREALTDNADGNPEPSLVRTRKVQRLDGPHLSLMRYGEGKVQRTNMDVAAKVVV